jgi:hypothetical protein
MSSKTVKRITLFKIPKEEDIDAILGEYQVLRSTAQKVRLCASCGTRIRSPFEPLGEMLMPE